MIWDVSGSNEKEDWRNSPGKGRNDKIAAVHRFNENAAGGSDADPGQLWWIPVVHQELGGSNGTVSKWNR